MAPSIKLVYFDREARAEIIRICFAFGKVPFEDKRISKEEFAAMKPTLPLEQVPVLHVDGFIYSQTMAMVRYASALSGIYPMEAPHVLKVESILGCYDELGMHIVQILHFIPDEAAKAAKTKELVEHTCPKVLGYVQNLISGKFVLDGKFSIADVAIFSIVDHYLFAMKGFNVSKYPKILSVVENVKAEPNIAAYLSKKV
ncbi:hypothetical protein ABG067_001714 [Albugo candida]|uniref:Glutathione S-transferase n=1 Tax=Albugo candida TaxID=65357 RepID=A0A024FYX3_9STRA|nr:unnamed protein product [Albugo candida]|eukprot:CCI39711.1 unnamed protein product [Albugo candida]